MFAQTPASCSETNSERHSIALLLLDVGNPSVSELSIADSNLTAATSLAKSSEGVEPGYDDAEYEAPTFIRH